MRIAQWVIDGVDSYSSAVPLHKPNGSEGERRKEEKKKKEKGNKERMSGLRVMRSKHQWPCFMTHVLISASVDLPRYANIFRTSCIYYTPDRRHYHLYLAACMLLLFVPDNISHIEHPRSDGINMNDSMSDLRD